MQIEITGIPIEITRKAIKKLYIHVKPQNGDVTISAPMQMSDAAIDMFARLQIGWIKQQRERLIQQPRETERKHIEGESYYLFGQQYYLTVKRGRKNNVTLSADNIILEIVNESSKPRVMKEWYRIQLKGKIEQLLPHVEEYTGLHCSEWRIRDMKTKWGTCIPGAGRIWFNLRLARAPIQCIEYVILHELVHLLDRTHGKLFKATMSKFMPNWIEIRSELNGCLL